MITVEYEKLNGHVYNQTFTNESITALNNP